MINKFCQIIYGIICLLLVVQIGLSSWRSTDGDRLSGIQQEINRLNEENSQIQNQIYQLTSLENVFSFANMHNMQPAVVTNLSAITVALNRQ